MTKRYVQIDGICCFYNKEQKDFTHALFFWSTIIDHWKHVPMPLSLNQQMTVMDVTLSMKE